MLLHRPNRTCCLQKFLYVLMTILTLELMYVVYVHFISVPSSRTLSRGKQNRTFEKYLNFDFDRANWTIYLKSSRDLSSDLVFKSLKRGKAIKRIIHQNGSVENIGCKNTTSMCVEQQHFSLAYKTRINTPPCCLKGLLTTLQHLCREFDRAGVSHMLAFGGVIGWVRYREIIPYESDLDMIVDRRFWGSTLMSQLIKRMTDLYGHVIKLTDNNQKMVVYFSRTNHLRVDIWPYERKIIHATTVVNVPHDAWKYQPVHHIFPFQRVTFSGIPVNIPAKPEAYLDTQYGRGNWEQEISCEVAINGKCQFYKSLLYTWLGLHWFV